MNKDKPKMHPELFKMFNSPIYRKKIKTMVESIKDLRGIRGTKLKGNMNRLANNATEKEREEAAKTWITRADKSTAHYWAQPMGANDDRRQRNNSPENK
jgi:hypothetical protein